MGQACADPLCLIRLPVPGPEDPRDRMLRWPDMHMAGGAGELEDDTEDNNYIVSSSEAGEMCTWDLVDGKCRESVKLTQVHTNIQVWSLLGHENKQSEPIYENESKQIRCLNALSLNCCAYNQRTVLIAPTGERWMSGDFLAPDRVMVWSTEGKGYLYKLPANSVPDHKGFHGPTVDTDSPVLFAHTPIVLTSLDMAWAEMNPS
ncbi:putative tgf-beta resistance-associated protein trag, partial [Operophtera brumata]